MNQDNYCSLELSKKLVEKGIMLETEEEWRDVNGYEGLYQVSNLGRVKSFRRKGNNKDRILNPFKTSINGCRRCVTLSKDGSDVRRSVHRLVAAAFHPNPDNLPEVNHKDGVPSNNVSSNLEWVTRSQNLLHAYAIGLKTNKGERNSNHILTEREVSFMRYLVGLHPNISAREIADFYDLPQTHVRSILCFRAWKETANG